MRPSKSPIVHVCALRHVPTMVERTGARHLVSAIDSDFRPATPKTVAAERHLWLEMHDIVEGRLDATPPAPHHVHNLPPFVRARDRRGRPPPPQSPSSAGATGPAGSRC